VRAAGGRSARTRCTGCSPNTLPADLLRHEVLLSREQVTDQTLTEIVDDVFLPLVGTPEARTFGGDGAGL
jgi:hypothetical protein